MYSTPLLSLHTLPRLLQHLCSIYKLLPFSLQSLSLFLSPPFCTLLSPLNSSQHPHDEIRLILYISFFLYFQLGE